MELHRGRATLKGTNTLAGSSTNLLAEVKKAVSFGLPLEAALTAVTLAPAQSIRLDGQIGTLTVGKDADLLLLDQDLELRAVYINGEPVL